MKRTLFTTAILLVLCMHASATIVEVFADQTNLTLGDSVQLNLHVVPEDTRGVGGQFQVSREVEPKKYRLLTIFVDYPSPSQCAECAGKVPLQSEKNSTYTFMPSDPGMYLVQASFGHASDSLYLNVSLPEGATTTTTRLEVTSTTLKPTATSPAVSSTTTLAGEGNDSGTQVATTLPAGQGILSGGLVLVAGLLAVVALAVFIAFKRG